MSLSKPLILASASPRRQELLARIGVEFEVRPADVDEDLSVGAVRAERVARRLARAKALAVAEEVPDAVVLAADTIVVDRGRLLGKPANADEATALLRALRGRRHRVITGVAVAHRRTVRVDHAVTWVQMRDYDDDEIAAYIATGSPFDKAGGYAIQDEGFRPVARYAGCYCNVVGLPLLTTVRLLRQSGILVPAGVLLDLPTACDDCPLLPTLAEPETAARGDY